MATVLPSTFLQKLDSHPQAFLTPDLPLYSDVVRYLKHTLDPIALQTSTEQQARLQAARKKRKRGENVPNEAVLRLKSIHTDNFTIDQIWEQARRVIAATKREAEQQITALQDSAQTDAADDQSELVEESGDHLVEEEDDSQEEDEVDGVAEDEDLDSDGEITNEAFDEVEMDSEDVEQPAEEFVADKFGLNDGFFSIDDFNRQSEFLEQRDTRGEDDGAGSDEEDIDWDTNPLGPAGTVAAGSEDDDNEEDGPTFGDPDAPSEDDMSIDGDDMGGLDMGNTNKILYADFFAPPAQKKSKKKKGRPNPHNFPKAEEQDVQRTIDAVQRDLFDDDDEEEDPDEEEEQLDPNDPKSRKSAHERRQAALAEEIRKLEAANVAKREWTMSGETRAADRPLNSLLEEDLEFERTGKPVPVNTAEVSESIEELIKRRILAFDFQDIPRRRPDDLATGSKRGRLDFELDNTKSKKGLAEEYEEEHLRETDPNFVEVKDEKLAKEQKEIEALWKDICGKLDSLSSWHFRPKQQVAQVDVRVDAPTVTMEDARPNAGGDVAAASQLAPQEIYKAGDGSKGVNAEVVGKSGLPAGREELSREEKKRRRRREKERIRKASGNDAPSQNKTAKKQKEVIGDLKKGGVKVIGKKGEMTDVEGNAARPAQAGATAARFKL